MRRRPAPRLPELVLGLALLGSIPILGLLRDAIGGSRWEVCLFRAATGRPCVFCGMTRALAEAAHGEWRRATSFHPLWLPAAAAILLVGVVALADGLAGTDRLSKIVPSGRMVLVALGLVVLLTLLRALFGPVPG